MVDADLVPCMAPFSTFVLKYCLTGYVVWNPVSSRFSSFLIHKAIHAIWFKVFHRSISILFHPTIVRVALFSSLYMSKFVEREIVVIYAARLIQLTITCWTGRWEWIRWLSRCNIELPFFSLRRNLQRQSFRQKILLRISRTCPEAIIFYIQRTKQVFCWERTFYGRNNVEKVMSRKKAWQKNDEFVCVYNYFYRLGSLGMQVYVPVFWFWNDWDGLFRCGVT